MGWGLGYLKIIHVFEKWVNCVVLGALKFHFQTLPFVMFCQKAALAFQLSRSYKFYQCNHSLKLPIQKEETKPQM